MRETRKRKYGPTLQAKNELVQRVIVCVVKAGLEREKPRRKKLQRKATSGRPRNGK